MARKPITSEDLKPSYDEVVNDLLATVSKLIMENTIMKLTIRKLEGTLEGFYQESDQAKNEF
jgi:hypothetical protein